MWYDLHTSSLESTFLLLSKKEWGKYIFKMRYHCIIIQQKVNDSQWKIWLKHFHFFSLCWRIDCITSLRFIVIQNYSLICFGLQRLWIPAFDIFYSIDMERFCICFSEVQWSMRSFLLLWTHLIFHMGLGEEKLVIRHETTADDSIVSLLVFMNETVLIQTHQKRKTQNRWVKIMRPDIAKMYREWT